MNTTGTAVCSLFRAGRYLEELQKYRPDIPGACEKAMNVVDPDLTLFASTKPLSLACPKSPLTMR